MFKKAILLAGFLSGITHLLACTHTIRLTDTFGDGWNGGIVKVQVNGADVLTNLTIASGFGPVDVTFNANAGDNITVIQTTAGSYPGEMRCEVFNPAMTSLGAAFQPVAGAGTSFTGSCPPPMTLTAATVNQASTATVSNCSANQAIVCLAVTTSAGASTPISLTQIRAQVTGTATNTGIYSASIYYTGTTNTFSTATLFGTLSSPGAGNVLINGTQTLATGTNYFWLAYSLDNTATTGTTTDGIINQFVAGGNTYNTASSPAIAVTDPAGNRTITVCLSPGGVPGIETWLKANAGTTGATPLTAWANSCATGTGTTLNGSPNLNTTATTYNYNPYVDFTGPVSPRQFVAIAGQNGIAGINYTSLFFAFQLSDLSRVNSHIATVNGVSLAAPVNGTFHGDADASGTQACILLEAYDAADFGTTSPAGTWKRNGVNIASNSIHSTSKHILSANCTTTPGGAASGNTVLNRFLGGQDDNSPFLGNIRDWRGPVGEVIGFTTQLTSTQRDRVESYLAIKYGITLTINYLATNGNTIFTTAAPYNNNIIGIGRDDSELLNQKQSHYDNDLVRIYLSTLAASNAANTGAFSADRSYIIMGDNNGLHCAQNVSNSEVPTGLPACNIYSRMDKEWKVSRSNMADNYNMTVQLSPACGIPANVVVSDLRLLVDDDGNFSNGGTSCFYNGDGTGLVFSYTNPMITVSGISTAHIPNNSTRFITIASINAATPLPVALLEFNAGLNSNGQSVDLDWTTLSEKKADRFEVQHLDGNNSWETILIQKVKGNNAEGMQVYTDIHRYPSMGMNYYRLKLIDTEGSFEYSEIHAVEINTSSKLMMYPNPAVSQVRLLMKDIADHEYSVIDMWGRNISPRIIDLSDDSLILDISGLSNGLYTIIIKNGTESFVEKLVVQH